MSFQFDIDRFMRQPDLAAQLVLARDLFTMMRRRISLPPRCAALVWGDFGLPRLVHDGGWVMPDGVSEVMFLKLDPVELHYDMAGLASSDGYEFDATLDVSVIAVSERAELTQLRQNVMGSSRILDARRIRQHCDEVFRSALTAFAQERTALDLSRATIWNDFDKLLAERFRAVGFESGLSLGNDPRVTFQSPAFTETRRTEATNALRKQRLDADVALRAAAVEARKAHLSRLEDVLAQVRSMSERHEGVALAELLRTFDPAERGELYHALATTQATGRTESIVTVAGFEMLRFDPAKPDRPTQRLSLDTQIGGLRSVRVHASDARRSILIGAATGVHVIDADGGPGERYEYDTLADVRGGVNAAAILNDRLYASHSEIGLLSWQIGDTGDQELCLADLTEGARAVRDVQVEDGRLWLAVDSKVIGWRPDTAEPPQIINAPREIMALVVADGWIMAGLDDGRVLRWRMDDPSEAEAIRGPGASRVRALAWIPGGGIGRLLIADDRPGLELQVLGDTSCARYRATQSVRWGYAADDLLVGVSGNRDSLFVWRVDVPEAPAATIPVSRLCGHSIQDVAILSAVPVASSDAPVA